MTTEQIKVHEEAGFEFHVPVIVHRTGGVSAVELNICGICGVQIMREPCDVWVEVDDETADKIRRGARH